MISNIFDKEKNNITSLFREKKFKDVINEGSNLILKTPDDSQILYILGLSYIELQDFINAEKYFEKLIKIKKLPNIYYTYGNIQKKLKKFDNAIDSFQKAINLNPNFSEAYNNLGNTKKIINKRVEAINHYKKAILIKEDNIEALINLSIILKENNNYEDLINVYKKILKLDNNNVKTIYNLGSAYLFLGDINKGRECFEKAIQIDKSHVPSLRNYVSITKINKENKIFKKLEDIDLNNINNENKILLNNALSKGYFDLDNVKKGFNYLNESNLIKKNISKFSIKEQEIQFQNIKRFFLDCKSLNTNFDSKIESKPLFIVGMPRSGTSLLEQILSSHSKIHGAGELNFLQKVIYKKGLKKTNNMNDYFSDIRKYYYNQITKISKNSFIIDKLPINFKWIGFILKSFPEAKIIHIKRNPMAVCWSNYKTHFFDSGMDFSLDQKEVAIYYSLYLDIIKFWKEIFKNKILDINYEDFVLNFKEQTKSILDYLDLEWEDQIKNYTTNKRAISTASFQQVREKIKKNTSDDWKMYRKYLTDIEGTLKDLNIKF